MVYNKVFAGDGTNSCWQQGIEYSDLLGPIASVRVSFVSGDFANQDHQEYPLVSTGMSINTHSFDVEYVCKKDAREIWGFAAEVSYFGTVTVYNSIARNHPLYLGRQFEKQIVGFARDYFPSKNSIFIDRSRCETSPNISVTHGANPPICIDFSLPAGNYTGIGLVNEIGELIMTIKKDFTHLGGSRREIVYSCKSYHK